MGTGGEVRVERWEHARTPDADALAESLRAEGYRVYQWTDPPGALYDVHSHTTDQSHWVVRGRLALLIDGREHVLGPGDRDWLPAGTRHAARAVGDEPVTYLIGERAPSAER